MAATWTSKLGNKFPRAQIESLDSEHHRILKALRKQPPNAVCAECEDFDTSWASVSLGVFVCVRCSDIHRAVGTHISKVKGCSGTYLWGPDEISRMQQLGNAEVRSQLGRIAGECKPHVDASKEERVALCRRKYQGACLHAEDRKLAAPVPEAQLAKAPRAASLSVAFPVARAAPQPSLLDDLFKDLEEAPVPASQPCFPADAGADARQPLMAEQAAEVPQASSPPSRSHLLTSAFDDFFGHSSIFAPAVKPPHQNEKAASSSTTPDGSTAASEDEFRACLDHCLPAAPRSHSATGPGVLESRGQPGVGQPADLTNIWDNFGEW